MGKVFDLNSELASLYAQLSEAEERRRKASLLVAGNPGDAKAREHAAGATRAIADIAAEIKILEDARADAEAADKSAEVLARKAKATEHLDAAAVRIAEREEVAKELDAALASFQEASKKWITSNQLLNQELRQFYKYALWGSPSHVVQNQTNQLLSLDRQGINALLSQTDAALVIAEVPRSERLLTYQTAAGQPSTVAGDIIKQSNSLLVHARAVAEREGIEIPAAAQESGAT